MLKYEIMNFQNNLLYKYICFSNMAETRSIGVSILLGFLVLLINILNFFKQVLKEVYPYLNKGTNYR